MAAVAKKTASSTKKAKSTPATASAAKGAKTPAKRKVPAAPVSGQASDRQDAAPVVVAAPEPVIVGPSLRKKEIIEEVVLRSGMKRRDVKPVLDVLLGVMGEGLAEGRELVVPPFGRIKVHRQKTTPKKRIFFAKVHRNTPPSSAETAKET